MKQTPVWHATPMQNGSRSPPPGCRHRNGKFGAEQQETGPCQGHSNCLGQLLDGHLGPKPCETNPGTQGKPQPLSPNLFHTNVTWKLWREQVRILKKNFYGLRIITLTTIKNSLSVAHEKKKRFKTDVYENI